MASPEMVVVGVVVDRPVFTCYRVARVVTWLEQLARLDADAEEAASIRAGASAPCFMKPDVDYSPSET